MVRKIYNRGWVWGGIVVFAAVVAFPLYWNLAGGERHAPELTYPASAKRCIESKAFMRVNHMRLLEVWRNAVVRDDLLTYTSSSGERFEMNLDKTCLGCHTSKDRFCTRCHEYNDVKPACWACHGDRPGAAKERSKGSDRHHREGKT